MNHTILRTDAPRAVFLAIVLLGTVLGTTFAAGTREAAPAGSPSPSPAPARVSNGAEARLVFLEGDVQLDGAPARLGDRVAPGSVIRTGPDGFADITFGTGNALRIENDTVLTLDLNNPAVGLDLRQGTIAAVFEGLASVGTGPEDTFSIRTPSTVAGVRGTAFFVHIESDTQTYVCTCHGILEFSDAGLTVRAARHNATRFTRTADGVVSEAAPEIYHDTASLNAVADVAGVTIAWGEEPEE